MMKIRKARRGANSFDDEQPTLTWSIELFNKVMGPSDSGWLCGLDETPFNGSGMGNFLIAQMPAGHGRRPGYYGINLTFARAMEYTDKGAPDWLAARNGYPNGPN